MSKRRVAADNSCAMWSVFATHDHSLGIGGQCPHPMRAQVVCIRHLCIFARYRYHAVIANIECHCEGRSPVAIRTPDACPGGLYTPSMNIRSVSFPDCHCEGRSPVAIRTPNACPGGLYSPPMNIRSVSIQRPPCVKGAAAQSARLGDCLSQQACTCLFLRKTTPPPLWGTSPYTGEAFSLGIVP